MALAKLGEDPWDFAFVENRWGDRNAFATPRMREPDLTNGAILQHPNRGPVHPEILDDSP
jgi:hypothetical protein